MRIIAGKYKGKGLLSPKNDSVRPTIDRIKETVFNIIQSYVPDGVVLDLFAGSGALGIECISRGASEVVFCDKNKESIDLIYKNLKGIEGNFRVIQADFLQALGGLKEKFDVIFLDPPYDGHMGEIAIDAILGQKKLADDGIIVFEHASGKEYVPNCDRVKVRTKAMGTVTTEFITYKSVGLVTGSFDPFTKGHAAVVDEALNRFDEVVVACLVNPEKQYMFTDEQRLEIARLSLADKKNVRVLFSNKTAVEVSKSVGASMFVRGVRGDSDSDYENRMKEYNRSFGIDTLFIQADKFKNISSSLAREEIKKGVFHSLCEGGIMYTENLMTNDK